MNRVIFKISEDPQTAFPFDVAVDIVSLKNLNVFILTSCPEQIWGYQK